VDSAELTELVPTEYRADLTSLRARGVSYCVQGRAVGTQVSERIGTRKRQ
jgi:hypothetical protein